MNHEDTERKRAVLFCTCSGTSPKMAKIDFWALAERVRLELGDEIEFMALHPRLCEEDGKRLMERVLSEDIACITPACAEKQQQGLLRKGLERAGVPLFSPHWIPVSMAREDTATVFEKIKAAIEIRALVEEATDEATAG